MAITHLKGTQELTTSAANIFQVADGSTATMQNIHVANRTGSAATFSMSQGTSTGTELLTAAIQDDYSVAANSFIEFGAGLKLGVAGGIRYIVVIASANSSLVMTYGGSVDTAS